MLNYYKGPTEKKKNVFLLQVIFSILPFLVADS